MNAPYKIMYSELSLLKYFKSNLQFQAILKKSKSYQLKFGNQFSKLIFTYRNFKIKMKPKHHISHPHLKPKQLSN